MPVERLFQILFWAALVFAFVMASLPQPPAFPGEPGDKLLHVLAFATLATLIVPAYPRVRLIILFVWLVLFGGLIELVQSIPALGREASLADWVADILASGSVLILARLLRRYCVGLSLEKSRTEPFSLQDISRKVSRASRSKLVSSLRSAIAERV